MEVLLVNRNCTWNQESAPLNGNGVWKMVKWKLYVGNGNCMMEMEIVCEGVHRFSE